MRRGKFFEFVVLLFLGLVPISVQAVTYTAANVKGSYSFLLNTWSTDAPGSEGAILGTFTFDGISLVTNSFTFVSSSGLKTGTGSGSYSVKSNGTGSITLNLSTGNAASLSFVLSSVINRVANSLQIIETDSLSTAQINTGGAVLTNLSGSATAANLNGSYSFLLDRWRSSGTGNQGTTVGLFTFDGVSKVAGSFTSISSGTILKGTLSGTYTVSANETGSLTFTLSTGGSDTVDFALNSVSGTTAKGLQLLDAASTTDEINAGSAMHQ